MTIEIRRVDEHLIARAGSFFLLKVIETGYEFDKLSSDLQDAILSHEKGHIVMRHTELSLLCLLLMPFFYVPLCWWQELQADRYAAKHGHASVLLRYLRYKDSGGWFHPSNATRRKFLKRYEQKISLGSR